MVFVKKLELLASLCLYQGIMLLLLPVFWLRLYYKIYRHKAYQKFSQQGRMRERLGGYQSERRVKPQAVDIHFHTVSVGEFLALKPLIDYYLRQHPDWHFLISTTTLTGSDQVLHSYGGQVSHVYLPWDIPFFVGFFLRLWQPRKIVLMETEIWPNLLMQARKHAIPVYLVNARLSEKSAHAYAKWASLSRFLLNHFQLIITQAKPDQRRFISLGALPRQVCCLGNIKFDLTLKAGFKEQAEHLRSALQWQNKLILVAASTHLDEDQKCLDCYTRLKHYFPALKLILVPRHPERFETVYQLAKNTAPTQKRSNIPANTLAQQINRHHDTEVLIGDSLGEMLIYYELADVVIMGGSLIPHGGHNLLEPAKLGKAIIVGPYMHNFATITKLFIQNKALIQLQSPLTLCEQTRYLLQNPQTRQIMGKQASQLMQQHSGVTEKLYQLLS